MKKPVRNTQRPYLKWFKVGRGKHSYSAVLEHQKRPPRDTPERFYHEELEFRSRLLERFIAHGGQLVRNLDELDFEEEYKK